MELFMCCVVSNELVCDSFDRRVNQQWWVNVVLYMLWFIGKEAMSSEKVESEEKHIKTSVKFAVQAIITSTNHN